MCNEPYFESGLAYRGIYTKDGVDSIAGWVYNKSRFEVLQKTYSDR